MKISPSYRVSEISVNLEMKLKVSFFDAINSELHKRMHSDLELPIATLIENLCIPLQNSFYTIKGEFNVKNK